MRRPDYYDAFRCIAGDCRHSCCIGWEIDLDADTLRRWRQLPEAAQADIFCHIEEGEPASIRLDASERCPFLNEAGLCRMILTYGEDILSQICRDHPRFRNFWGEEEEIGLGAACEAAAELILSQKNCPAILDADTSLTDPDAVALYALRDRLFAYAWADDLTIPQREESILSLSGGNIPDLPFVQWIEFYRSLERLDEAWTAVLDSAREVDAARLAAFDCYMAARQSEYAAMLHYFLFRHLPAAQEDEDPGSKAAFAVLSCRMLRMLGATQLDKTGAFTLTDQTELFRLYSSEIEYSEDNTAALYDALWEGDF